MFTTKTILFVHGDSDGIVSGALAYKYYALIRREEVKVVFSHPTGLYTDLIEFANYGDRIFIADIALNEQHIFDLIKLFKEFERRGELIYIDHHPEPLSIKIDEIPGTIVHDLECSASELTYKFFSEELGYEYTRVALYGAIADYLDETEWVRKTLSLWDKRTIYFEAGVLSQGIEASRRLYDFKRHVLKHLSENRLPSSLSELLIRSLIESMNEEELRKWVKLHVNSLTSVAYVLNPPGSLGKAALYARTFSGKIVGIAISKHKNMYTMSFRLNKNDPASKYIDLNKILRTLAPRYKGSGGGHAFAAGARIPLRYLRPFLIELDSMINNLMRTVKT